MYFLSKVVFLQFMLLTYNEAHGNNHIEEQISAIPSVDYIMNYILEQDWDGDEETCRKNIYNILDSVKNSTLWATWVWNSIDQSPTGMFFGSRYHLGGYDQCLRPPWLAEHPELRTQYCLVELEMNRGTVKTMEQVTDPYEKAENYYVHSQTSFGRSFSYLAHGICLPAGCQIKSVEKFTKVLMNAGYLRAAKNATMSISHCEEAGAAHEYTRGFYIYMYVNIEKLFVSKKRVANWQKTVI